MKAESFGVKARTALRIGLPNLARVAFYRAQIRFGRGAAGLVPIAIPAGDVFRVADAGAASWPAGSVTYFDWLTEPVAAGVAPDWHRNPINGMRYPGADAPWHQLPDFDPIAGDIKCFWELSRFGWAVRLAHQGDAASLRQLNGWLADWIVQNPAYRGPNWKCGQETSLRVLHLAVAALMLDQARNPTRTLRGLLRSHLRRVAPTIHYAVAQDNNHGTSEAAALFVGGNWLASVDKDPESSGWAAAGRRWLENRFARLIEPDGSFSQYSVNYHRLILDTLSIVEIWRRAWELPSFADVFYARATAATDWLHAMTQPGNGDAPVLGANDGARLLQITDSYRDYRTSVQLAAVLFRGARAYESPAANALVDALRLACAGAIMPAARSRSFDDGGYAILRSGRTTVYARYPRYRFRPSHADALHVDVWHNGENVLRDGGTFSYHASTEDLRYFPGTESHNTVQFDDRDQMPRLSRFLFGEWLGTIDVTPVTTEADGRVTWAAGYKDWRGATHRRALALAPEVLTITDTVAGFTRTATLRFRLKPGAWRVEDQQIVGADCSIAVAADRPIKDIRLTTGRESRHYLQQNELPVAEIVLTEPATIVSTVRWTK